MSAPYVETLVKNYEALVGGPGPVTLHGVPRRPDFPDVIGLNEAYAAQRTVVQSLFDAWGSGPAGFKLGLTTDADQANMGTDEPALGRLSTAHLLAVGTPVSLIRANAPLVEPELLLRPSIDLEPGVSDHELLAALEVTGGIEVPVSRIPDWLSATEPRPLTLGRFVSDNCAAGFLVVGDQWRPAGTIDLSAVTVELHTPNGSILPGSGSRALGNPLRGLRWLVDRLDRDGELISAGSIVASGTLLRPEPASPGDFTARFSHDLGTVPLSFVL